MEETPRSVLTACNVNSEIDHTEDEDNNTASQQEVNNDDNRQQQQQQQHQQQQQEQQQQQYQPPQQQQQQQQQRQQQPQQQQQQQRQQQQQQLIPPEATFDSLGIINEATFVVHAKLRGGAQMQIFLKTLNGSTKTMECSTHESICHLYSRVANSMGIPAESIRLHQSHSLLSRSSMSTLLEKGIENATTIWISLILRGGTAKINLNDYSPILPLRTTTLPDQHAYEEEGNITIAYYPSPRVHEREMDDTQRTVFINTGINSTIATCVRDNTSTKHIYKTIALFFDIPNGAREISVMSDEHLLPRDRNMEEVKLNTDIELTVKMKYPKGEWTFPLFVLIPNRETLTVHVNRGCTTDWLILWLAFEMKIHPSSFAISYGCRPMLPGNKLGYFNITSHCNVMLNFRLRGGMPHTESPPMSDHDDSLSSNLHFEDTDEEQILPFEFRATRGDFDPKSPCLSPSEIPTQELQPDSEEVEQEMKLIEENERAILEEKETRADLPPPPDPVKQRWTPKKRWKMNEVTK